ncbi:MAG: fatty acid desaturase [Polyangiaceae bacterium]|nr:fatty acid desaturase [Polyangiaceae bacterium]
MSLVSPRRLVTARIDDRTITVRPSETLLQAALREGVELPHGCRVGGCGACKCRLVAGRVDELTETGYLLSAEELDRGVVLACQSVPRTDVVLEVDRSLAASRRVAGRVVGQRRVTHDITELRIQLDAPLRYEAGQFARLTIEGVPVTRSYSFASPAREDGEVSFFVRKVPGGALSTVIDEQPLVGRAAVVDGPHGDFWLRPSDAPLLLVAGGSGLGPVLAILEAAADAGVTRDVTVVFGARARRDVFAEARLDAVARRLRGAFERVVVLSDAGDDPTWTGPRGLVTEVLPPLIRPGAHAYLCGPPAMVDAAVACLSAHGVAAADIRSDRFTTRADAPPPPPPEPASSPWGALHYAKFFGFHAVGLFAWAALLAGGPWITAGLLVVLALYMLGDALCGDDTSTPTYRHPGVLTAQLWLALPLLAGIVVTALWTVSPGDPLGVGALVRSLTGYDARAARDAAGLGSRVSSVVLTGLMIGMLGTITAHELTHRTWDKVSMAIGRWLLAFSFDTSFAIEHVYGHHRYVATTHDPATAPRGRSVYVHVVASSLRGNASAWAIERARLERRRLAVWSRHNVFLRGQVMSASLVAAAWALGGWRAAAFFTLSALWGKALLEIVNYMEHYGMVRDPATPVAPRHSWNTNRRVSSWTMFNLTRHSHHHAAGEVPYHELRPYADAPMMINGYLTTIVVALVPPLWHLLMTPKVRAWDRDFASPAERELAALANARSGLPALSGPAVELSATVGQ